MDFLIFVVLGIIAGTISGRVVEGRTFGLLGDAFVGVLGALVGGYFFDAFGITTYGFGGAFVMSILGAVVFLSVVNLFSPKTTVHRHF